MRKKYHLIAVNFVIVAFIGNSLSGFSQSISDNFWGACRNDKLYDFVIQMPYLYMVGGSNSFTWNATETYLCKVDTSAKTLWARTYVNRESNLPVADKILYTSENRIALTGWNTFLLLDSSGNILYGKRAPIWTQSIIQTYDKNFLLGGYNPANLVKIDSVGEIIYSRLYRGGHRNDNISPDGYSVINSLTGTSDSGFVATGYTNIDLQEHPFILKADKVGNLIWTRTYNRENGLSSDGNIIVDTNSEFVICGNAEGISSPMPFDPFVLKVNSLGSVLWSKVYRLHPSSVFERKIRISKFLDGGYILAGTLGNDVFDDKTYYFAICIDSNGNVKWAKKYGDSKINICTSISVDNNSILLGGYSNELNDMSNSSQYPYQTDMHIIRIDSAGYSTVPSEDILIEVNDYIDGLLENPIKDSLIISEIEEISFSSNLVYSNYDSLDCIGTGFSKLNIDNNLVLTPNPVRSKAIIRLDNVRTQNMILKLYNSYGVLIRNIAYESTDFIEFDRQDLASGFYFINVYNDNQLIGTSKMLIE